MRLIWWSLCLLSIGVWLLLTMLSHAQELERRAIARGDIQRVR